MRAEQIGGYEQPAEELPPNRAGGESDAAQAQRPGPRRTFKVELHPAQPLWQQQRSARTLGDAGDNEHDRRRRKPTDERRQAEAGEPEQEQAAAAVRLPEPRAG